MSQFCICDQLLYILRKTYDNANITARSTAHHVLSPCHFQETLRPAMLRVLNTTDRYTACCTAAAHHMSDRGIHAYY